MLSLRLALGAIALMAVATAGMGGLAILDQHSLPDGAPPLLLRPANDSSFWRAVAAGAKAAAKAHGVELQVEWPRRESLLEASLGASHECSHDRVGTLCGRHAFNRDLLLAANLSTSSSEPLTNAHTCAGGLTLRVSMADYSAGELCAQTAVEAMPGGGTIAVLMATNPSKSARGRFDGLSHHLRQRRPNGNVAGPNEIKVVVHRVDQAAPERLGRLAQEVQQHGVQLVIDLTDAAVEPLLRAFDGVNPSARPRIITFDSSDLALEAIEMANLLAIVTPSPFQCGYQAVSRLSLLQQRGFLEHPADGRGSILLPPQVVRQGMVAEFRASRRADRHAL